MFRDAFHRELQQGDYITYGKNFGRSAGLGVGRVLGIRAPRPLYAEWSEVREPDEFVLDVMTLQGWRPIEDPEYCFKTTLQFEERALRLSPEEIPSEQRMILDKAYTEYLAQRAKKENRK